MTAGASPCILSKSISIKPSQYRCPNFQPSHQSKKPAGRVVRQRAWISYKCFWLSVLPRRHAHRAAMMVMAMGQRSHNAFDARAGGLGCQSVSRGERSVVLHPTLCPMLSLGGSGRKSATQFMEVLKRLFEQHFHSPVERVQPLQGELGGSGRKIIRLDSGSGKISAIGILYN